MSAPPKARVADGGANELPVWTVAAGAPDPSRASAQEGPVPPGPASTPADIATTPALPGRRLGRAAGQAGQAAAAAYRLLEPIASGGAGEVWEAEQGSLGRVIAVKRLRASSSRRPSASAQAEFRSESMIAASLEHPNIVPVYDLGRDADGSLLLAMKRVRGRPWDELLHADLKSLPPESFFSRHLRILVAVTQAVAFAHSRGIVHRDIKPAQVLVGGFGEVLLTDWGLALRMGEAIDQEDESDQARSSWRRWAPTPATASSPAGTPALMAPEQTEDDASNQGPWTDVYLLGATLYYLLTGTYPHAAESAAAAVGQARTGVIEPPSKRSPDRVVPPELEQLCLAALEPDRGQRLVSAEAFLEGIEDFQRGTARKQRAVALLAELEHNLEAGAIGYTSSAAALATLDEAQQLWPENPAAAPVRQRLLEHGARLALAEGDLGFARVHNVAMAPSEARDRLEREITDRRHRLERRRTWLRATTGMVLALLVLIATGAVAFSARMRAANEEISRRAAEAERALAIAKDRSAGAFDMIQFVLDDLKTALDNELSNERGFTADGRNEIAHAVAGTVAMPVLRYFEDTTTTNWPVAMQLEHGEQMRRAAEHFRQFARTDEALRLYLPALALRESLLGPDHAEVAVVLGGLAGLHEQAGRLDEAEPLFRRAVAVAESAYGPDHPEVAKLLDKLASFCLTSQRLDEAEEHYRRAIEILEVRQHEGLDQALANLGTLLNRRDRPEEAEAALRRALALREASHGAADVGVGYILDSLAAALRAQKRLDEAEPLLRRGVAVLENALGPTHPQVGTTVSNLAGLLRRADRFGESEPLARRAIAIQEASYGPSHFRTARSVMGLGYLLYDLGRWQECADAMRRATEIFEKAFGPDHLEIGWTLSYEGFALQRMGRRHEARVALERAVRILTASRGPEHKETIRARQALDESKRSSTASP